MRWYIKVLKNYTNFSDRARRKEYWMAFLFNVIFAFIMIILDHIFGIVITGVGYGPLYIIYGLALLIPGIAVTIRRLHDTGRSGWWLFIGLVPFIGAIWLLVLLVLDSQQGENKYGSNPKVIPNEDTL
jgi:uncharacterized membrane protein YhaH (DUF805 family)